MTTRHWGLPTNTQDNHKEYTSIEWNESAYFEAVIDFLKEKNIKSFIDVGGCTGEVSNIILNKIPSIEYGIIFEPQPDNFEYIKKNVVSDKILIKNTALFYGEEYIDISVRNPNVGSWSFALSENYHQNSIKVKCDNLDDYLKEKEYDFLKIDIEGGEFNLLLYSELLKEVKYIELELHHEYFEMYRDQSKIENLQNYSISKGNITDFVLKNLPNHEIEYYMCGESEEQQKNPGNIFLIKKT